MSDIVKRLREVTGFIRFETGDRVAAAASISEEAADEIERLEAERKRLVAALVQCREEIDYYIRQEYPGDHPIHERYRKRDLSANPARIALENKE